MKLKCVPGTNAEDLAGRKFGKLTAISLSEKRYRGQAAWLCRCDCGSEALKWVPANSLKRGNTGSCGCLRVAVPLPPGVAASKNIFKRYKADAKKRGLEFSITLEAALGIFSKCCTYCGAPPSATPNRGVFNGDFTYSGIDRIDSSIGYVSGNCTAACYKCNRAKSSHGVGDYMEWLSKSYNHILGAKFRVRGVPESVNGLWLR